MLDAITLNRFDNSTNILSSVTEELVLYTILHRKQSSDINKR